MNLKKNLGRHLIMLAVLGVFGLFAAGSTIDAYGKGMKAYQAGDYAKAKKIWSESPDVKSLNNRDYIEAAWYLGEIYQKEGNEEAALEWKTKAYNAVVGSDYNTSRFKADKAETYEAMLSDSLIKTVLAKQKAEQVKQNFVGTWRLLQCQHDGSKYEVSRLQHYPKRIVLNENGTGTIYWEYAKDTDFTWSADGGSISFSVGSMPMVVNKSGYIVLRATVMTKNLRGILLCDFFFGK